MHSIHRTRSGIALLAALALGLATPARAADDSKTVIIDGKVFTAQGRSVVTDGKTILIDGKPAMIDGKPLQVEGKTVTIDGQVVSRAGVPTKAPPPLVFTIDLRWLGASSYRLEKDITTPIERAVRTLPDVVSVHSTTLSGRAQTRVAFDPKVDASSTATAIRNRLDQIKRTLPRDASQPLIGWSREPTP